MKIEQARIPIVCDVDNCGRLSAYRLTFDNNATYYLCDKCLKEIKSAKVKVSEKNEK